MSEPEIPKIAIRTSCRDCVFAVYEGDTPADPECELGRIAQFEAQGATVTGLRDDTKEYLVVDRFCNACHAPDSKYLAGVPPAGWAATIRDLVRVRAAILIYVCDGASAAALRATLRSLAAMDPRPVRAVILLDGGLAVAEAAHALRSVKFPYAWEILAIEPPDEAHERLYGGNRRGRAVDLAAEKLDPAQVTYYTLVAAGDLLRPDFLGRLDAAINDAMIPVAAIRPDAAGRGLTVQTKLHAHPEVVGCRGADLLEKLDWVEAHYGAGFRILAQAEIPACEEAARA